MLTSEACANYLNAQTHSCQIYPPFILKLYIKQKKYNTMYNMRAFDKCVRETNKACELLDTPFRSHLG